MSTVAQAVGRFVWHEQVSSEPQQAQDFYTQLFGWDAERFGESDYTMIASGGAAHGGYGTAMEGAPPPHWLSHVQVEDVDATVEKAKAAGGDGELLLVDDVPHIFTIFPFLPEAAEALAELAQTAGRRAEAPAAASTTAATASSPAS